MALFIFGFFWKRATADGAFYGLIGGFVFLLVLKFVYPELPFLDQMGVGFLVTSLLIMAISLKGLPARVKAYKPSEKGARMGLLISILVISLPVGILGVFSNEIGSGAFYFALSIILLSLGAGGLLFREKKADDEKAIEIDKGLFATDPSFNVSTVFVCLILTIIYIALW